MHASVWNWIAGARITVSRASMAAAVMAMMSLGAVCTVFADTLPREGAGSAPPMTGEPPSARREAPEFREDERGPPRDMPEFAPDADEGNAAPYSGGCPYRGRKLELIV